MNKIKEMAMLKKTQIVKSGIFVVLVMALIYRCFYGIDNGDEGFYFSLLHRLHMGDALVVDDWYPVQLFAFLVLPIYKLYIFLIGNNEGIVLFFRFFCLALKIIISLGIYIYFGKEKNRNFAAYIAAVLFLLYERDNILNISYYYLGAVFAFTSGFLLYIWSRTQSVRKKYLLLFFSGITFSFATVSNPYFIFVFLFLILWFLVNALKHQLCIKEICVYLSGIGLVATVFFIFLFSRATLAEIWKSIPYILNDPIHPPKNIWYEFFRWFWIIIKEFGWLTIFGLMGITLYVCLLNIQKKEISQKSKKIILWINLIILLNNILCSTGQIGLVLIAISFFGFVCFLLTEKKDINLFSYLFCMGIGVSMTFSFASDTGITSVIIGFSLSAVAALIFVADFLKETNGEQLKRIQLFVGILCFIAPLILMFYMRMVYVWRDYSIPELTYQTPNGPYKNIFTSPAKGEMNEILITDLKYINSLVDRNDQILISKYVSWGYSCIDCSAGTYTIWKTEMNNKQLEAFYQLNPEKIPNYVYIIKPECFRHNEDNPLEGMLWDYICAEDYECQELKSGYLYFKDNKK